MVNILQPVSKELLILEEESSKETHMFFILIFLAITLLPQHYAINNNLTLIDEYDAVEPGFRPLTPEDFRAKSPASPILVQGNDRGALPQFPDFGISFQNSDPDRQRREREQKEREEASIRKKQDDLKRMQDDLKRRQDEIKRQQEDFQKRQLEEWKRQENEKKRREDAKRELERKREGEKPRKQLKQPESSNINNSTPNFPQVNQNIQNTSPRNENKKNDPKKDKKESPKKDDRKKPQPNRGRRQLPKRFELPKNAGIGGNLGGKIPDPGIAIDPEDRYTGRSAGYSLSPSFIQIALIALLIML